MEIKSLKHNFFMYFLRLFSGFGFTIFIFPYIARKLGAEGIGRIQYIEIIVSYFILFINLGVADYGKREVAICRDNSKRLNDIVNDLLTILYITTALGVLVYLFFICFFVQDKVNSKLLYIYFVSMILNMFNVEWFYVGMENQEYITKRNIILKIFSAILIFLFVKTSEDIYFYAGILVLATTGSNIYNFFNLRKYVSLKIKKYKDIKRHFRRLFYIFFSAIALSISYNLDSLMIGKMVGDTELGYYSLAGKFGRMPLVLGTVVITILAPRLTNLLGQNNKKMYYKLWKSGIDVIFIFYIPLTVGMYLLSKPLVLIIGGVNFIEAVPMFRLFSIYITIMGFACLTGVTLDTHSRDKEYSISVIIGSSLNFLFNIFFIMKIGAIGAVIATLITEIVAILVRIVLCKDIFKKLKLIDLNMLKLIGASIIMGGVVFYIERIIQNIFLKVGISTIVGAIVYGIVLVILKERVVLQVISKLKKIVNLQKA